MRDYDEATLATLTMVMGWMRNLSQNAGDADVRRAAFDVLQALRWLTTPAEKTEVVYKRRPYQSHQQLGEMFEHQETERSGQG